MGTEASYEIRIAEAEPVEEPVGPHRGARHARGQKGADPRLREERHGLAASEAETV